MPMTRGEPLDLSGIPKAGGGASAPSPSGGGGATNLFNQSASVPTWDQWMHQPIFLGHAQQSGTKPGTTDVPIKMGKVPQWGKPFQLLTAFDSFTQTEYQKFKNQLVAAGFVSAEADPVQVRDTFKSLLADIQSANAAGQMITPQQFINSMIRKNGIDPKSIKANKDYNPAAELAAAEGFKPSTSTATSVYDMDPADAEDLLSQTLEAKLGRAPSRAEIEDFVDAVKSRALANPTTVTTKTRRGDLSGQAGPGTQVQVNSQGGETFSTVTSVNEGFDADNVARMAERRAKNAPDYASAQAVSTYFPAFLNALGATV